ncbi:MAG: hypothetical protein EOP22_08540 [Hyphomicrobiales bacterium]|nr:MAG: hypothetical protein EOP22_08540 [Hyphomicrobiales bacterium]
MNWLDFGIYGWCVLGIVISVVLPPLWAVVQQRFPANGATPKGLAADIWYLTKPYLALGAASALTALLLLAVLGDNLVDPRAAILAGYAWDSTLQKLR